MKTRLTRTVLTGAVLLAQLGALTMLPARAKMTAPVLAENSSRNATRRTESESATRMRIAEAYGKLPLSFEQNQGQTDRKVKFLSRGPNYALLLTQTEAVLSLQSEKADSASDKTRSRKREVQSSSLRMKLIGANTSPKIEGRERLQGKSNYLIGNDRKKWHTDIPTYSRVQYNEVYPGIDLVYYGNQRRLEYDFVVAPGADASIIRVKFKGADEMSLEADGSLRLKLKGGEVTQPAPVIYQTTESGERQVVAGHYRLKGEEVAFEIAAYDRSRELVIDPQLLYATFYGGSDGEAGEDIAVDGSGNAYITGKTFSTDLVLKSAYQGPQGESDVYVVKLNPSGSDILYATYLGSTNHTDEGEGIAVTSDGKACVTGTLFNLGNNSDFPTTPNRFQGNGFALADRATDVFVTVLAPGGNALVYSTFFGGAFGDKGLGIAVDAANKIYVTGHTFGHFPIKNAFQNSMAGGVHTDAFIAKFDPAQSGNSSLVYSSYLGGAATEVGRDVAVTPGGVAFVVGVTGSIDFPQKSSSSLPAFQTAQGGVNDAFVAKVSSSGGLIYATYFGGDNVDEALRVAVDSNERAYVTGHTASSAATFPLQNAFDATRDGLSDAFVAKFNADGTALFFSSFLGGTADDFGQGIAIDASGNAYVTGRTTSPSPDVNGFPASVPSGTAFIAKIEPSDGTSTAKILYSDTFGGLGTFGHAMATDLRGNVYITGRAVNNLQTTAGAFQETFNGGNSDAFVVKINSTFPDTIGVFQPPASARSVNDFQLRNSNTPGPAELIVDFGQAGDQPLAGDWNGDGVDDVGVYRPSTAQFLLRQPTRLLTGILIDVTLTINFGLAGDKAIVGDWNGDGIDTVGVFRNGTFLLSNGPNINGSSPPADLSFAFGTATISTDLPVAGDWNGDGIDTIGVFRGGANGEWFLRNTNATGAADLHLVQVGTVPGVLPVVGDWDGDGVDTIGLFLNGFFFFRNTNTSGPGADLTFSSFAQAGDLPVAGDWDGKPANTPPNAGVNVPADGSSAVGQTQIFTTTCSDQDGWRDLATIDFRIARGKEGDKEKKQNKDEDGNTPVILWVQFDENRNLIRFYDPDLGTWQENEAGANLVFESRFAKLFLSSTTFQGTGPLGPAVNINWSVAFKEAANGKYRQYLKITDDEGETTGFDIVGSWKVTN